LLLTLLFVLDERAGTFLPLVSEHQSLWDEAALLPDQTGAPASSIA
jgi:hypothetical protein